MSTTLAHIFASGEKSKQ